MWDNIEDDWPILDPWGTHNSTAYTINWDIPVKNKKWEQLRQWCQAIPCLKKKIEALTLCQDYSIEMQLGGGVYGFDIRLIEDDQGQLWCSHTFATISLNRLFEEIVAYGKFRWGVKDRIFHIRSDPEHPPIEHLKHKFLRALKRFIYPQKAELELLVGNDVVDCILAFAKYEVQLDMHSIKFEFNESTLPLWHNTEDTEVLMKQILEPSVTGHFAVLTPQHWFPWLFTSIEKQARKLYPLLKLSMVRSNRASLLYVDFFSIRLTY